MRFSELSEEAKETAVIDYIIGWRYTHPDEIINYEDAYQYCLDTDYYVDYNENGVIK